MVEKFSVPIPTHEAERTIRVYLPKSYEAGDRRYPVLYAHDGQNLFHDADATGGVSLGLEAYFDTHGVEMIVVGIDSVPGEQRIIDYYAWAHGEFSQRILGEACTLPAKGEAYIDFIVQDLKPLIDRKYRTLENSTAMAGISSGGSISMYAACAYPHIFKRIAGFSNAFYRNQEGIEDFVRDSDLSLLENVYLDCGAQEGKGEEEIAQIFLGSNRSVYEILKQKFPQARFRVVEDGEHSYEHFKKRAPEVLASLFEDIL
ncbi:alpha/beta hydrolase [Tumebacillus sp. ITR2]|uniref:Alpha/beta hydrolase n=1 Tax=Tumebacillus amylolyticus TaxID=2801339 RepID=A0ABS1J6U3_9BACL|nr:alpha/beta hydrolase-fold protein [Tumebacillus amylolyticus]MBL0385991.1 alpha/beta hydrolase [Tumebacillus amylolyticus]